jgi:hypothetical protein
VLRGRAPPPRAFTARAARGRAQGCSSTGTWCGWRTRWSSNRRRWRSTPIQHRCAPDSGPARSTVRVDQTGRMRSDPRRPLATLSRAGAIGCPNPPRARLARGPGPRGAGLGERPDDVCADETSSSRDEHLRPQWTPPDASRSTLRRPCGGDARRSQTTLTRRWRARRPAAAPRASTTSRSSRSNTTADRSSCDRPRRPTTNRSSPTSTTACRSRCARQRPRSTSRSSPTSTTARRSR